MKSEQLVKLYIDAFPSDGIKYAEHFVSKVNENNIVTLEDNGNLVSVAYIVEKTADFNDKFLPVSYLSAVSTITEKRGQGLIKSVIQKALLKVASRSVPLVALYPFSFEYYKRFGFINASYCGKNQIVGGIKQRFHIATREDIPFLIDIYGKFAKEFSLYQTTNEQYYIDLFSELDVDGGRIYLSDACDFYAVVEGGEISRYAYTNKEKFISFDELKGYKFSDFTENDTPYIQMRIASINDFLSLDLYQNDGEYIFSVYDDMIEENCGNFLVVKKKGNIIVDKTSNTNTVQSISSLLQSFLSGYAPFKKVKTMFMDKY